MLTIMSYAMHVVWFSTRDGFFSQQVSAYHREIHLTLKTIQNAFSRIPCDIDLSHNCSQYGEKSKVCEKYKVMLG